MNNGSEEPSVLQGNRLFTLADTHFARLGLISDDERAALEQVSVTPRTLSAGDELIQAGSSPDSLYFMTEGWAYRSITTRSGARQIPTLVAAGGVCNLDNLLFERADFGVRAITNITMLAVPRNQALELSAQYPGVSRAFALLALAENAILTQWAVGLGRRSALERLAHLLCEMSVRIGANDADGRSFDLPLTQELLADMLGLTAVHVNRSMQHLRTSGFIATAGRCVTILDTDALRHLAQFDPGYLNQIAEYVASPPPPAPDRVKEDTVVPFSRRVAAPQRATARDDELLLRETHHRCSNDLQLIVGLLELQSRRAASEETRQALADAVERVGILARSRNALNGERQPSLEVALKQVCEGLQAHAEPRSIMISAHVENEIRGLSPAQITTLSLVVNELATNAIKHAFDIGTAGHIQIRIGANIGRGLAVIVEDDGRPFHDAPVGMGSGLGLGLAKRLMASIGGLFIPPPPGSKAFELRLPTDGG